MFLNGAPLEECLETIVQTLPICQVRQVAYSTFSILQVFNNGDAYLAEFDNPGCIFIRDGKLFPIPKNERTIKDKTINEFRFKVQTGDTLVLMSDGTTHAGVGRLWHFGWEWEDIARFVEKQCEQPVSSIRLASAVCGECDELYQYRPGDDTTVAVMRIIERKTVHLMTGPPVDRDDDRKMVEDFMAGEGVKRIVSGGTTATILSRILGQLQVSIDYYDPDIPPIAHMEGVELVTEGVLTLNRAVSILTRYVENKDLSRGFFEELDKNNGASMIARMLLEDCTDLHLFVGKAVNGAYQSSGLLFELGIRQNLVKQLIDIAEKMGKSVTVTYY